MPSHSQRDAEVPDRPVSVELLKPLCEQRGAQIASRALFSDPSAFKPSALPIITSNFLPKLMDPSESGTLSHFNVFITRFIWTMYPSTATERLAVTDLADLVLEGCMDDGLTWLAAGFYPCLDESCLSRNIGPKPPRILADTIECFKRQAEAGVDLQEWVSGLRAVSVDEAPTAAAVRIHCAETTGLAPDKVPTAMTGLGLLEDRTTVTVDGKRTTKRYYKRIFGGDEPRPVGLAARL